MRIFPRSAVDLMKRYGHEAIDVRDIGLRGVKDAQIANYAQREKLCLVTGDFDFSDIRNYPPAEYSGLVVLGIPRNAIPSLILNMLESFLQEEKVISRLSGNLAIVEPGRVRIRTGNI